MILPVEINKNGHWYIDVALTSGAFNKLGLKAHIIGKYQIKDSEVWINWSSAPWLDPPLTIYAK